MYLCKLWPRDRKTKTCDVVPVLIVGGGDPQIVESLSDHLVGLFTLFDWFLEE